MSGRAKPCVGGATIPSMNLIPSEYSVDKDSRTSRTCSRVRGAARAMTWDSASPMTTIV